MGICKTIEEGALFVADAHYPNHGSELLELLQKIDSREIDIPQLFLMGDIFDLLVGGFEESYIVNMEVIELIEAIGRRIPVYYFEGNHDFRLDKIFTNINIFKRELQPQYTSLNGFAVGMSHGDRYAVGWRHDLMSRLLRSNIILKAIKILKPDIISKLNSRLKEKNICHDIKNFDLKAREIYDSYRGVFWVIEGHYHQAEVIGNYISLPSLACHKKVGIVEGGIVKFISLDELYAKHKKEKDDG